MHDTEAPAVAQEVVDLEVLAGHDHDVVSEPRAIDVREARVVEPLDVDPVDLRADLRAERANLDHRVIGTVRLTTGATASANRRIERSASSVSSPGSAMSNSTRW